MRIRPTHYIGSSLALLAISAFVFSPFVKAAPGEGSKGEKAAAAPAAVFTNPAPITINDDGVASPYPSDINVTGLAGVITSVKITLNGFAHSFPDDVGMVLKGPTGAALLIQDGAGGPSVNLTYSIADSGATPLPNQTAWTPGTYKPANYYLGDSFPAPGPITAYGNPGPIGGGTATFASTFNGTASNGTWSLFVVDFVGGDVGVISGGWTLEITTITGDPFGDRIVDFNGDGKTDWAIFRNTGGGQGTWFIQENSVAGPITYQPWGRLASDFPVPQDYDGDNKTDIAVWRDPGFSGGQGAFYILQSQASTVRAELFGITGDDPTVIGDYDNDGKTDLAVVRRSGGLMFWYYRVVANGPVFARQWGLLTDFPAPGDYDGDGKADFVVQRNGSPATFWANYGAAAPGVLSRMSYFGLSNELNVPGDYDGDGKTDIAIIREVNGSMQWFYEPSSAPGTFLGGAWGDVTTDFIAQGDYDGDGKTDFAVWRTNPDPTQNFFLVRKSSDGALLFHEWGQENDFPVAAYNTH